MKYEIGQQVWWAVWEATTDYVECPDCAGTARVRVMLPDDTIVSIECEGCRRGYDGATGRIQVYKREAAAKRVTITGVEIDDGKTEWKHTGSYRSPEDSLFDNEADALACAQKHAAEEDLAERERVNKKEKPLKSWAWHAHYHRKCIKDAQRLIDYHTARLAVANIKKRDEKK
jgi:hypothetical protein